MGHGFYKAWSFLRSGDLPLAKRSSAPTSPVFVMTLAVIGTVVSIPLLALASMITGFSPLHSPGEMALSAIVSLSIGQLWIALIGVPGLQGGRLLVRVSGAVVASIVASVTSFALYRGAGMFLEPVLGELPVPTGPLAWALATLPVAMFVTLTVVYTLLGTLGRTSAGRAFYVHALNGFYFGVIADRVVGIVWNRLGSKGVQNA
jgi:hypothetical protein